MDDSDDDDNCYYGTPLEELDEDDARRAKAPRVEDQVVCDKQGRRRFHGAFTGGFSAGYFNSVGTKEGWTPSTFVSSRNQRMGAKQTKPQDFMDDEDLAAHGISPQGIQATSSFDDSENKKRKRVLDPSGPIPGIPVLEEILRPNKETMGMKLLRKLGWKPGQGIGPRVKMSQKKLAQKEAKKIYGCHLPQDKRDESDEDVDEDDYRLDVTFAPDDVETMYLSTPKSDQFGLGYKPLDRTPVLGGHINLFDPSPLSMTEKKKKLLIKGQAFGVGAFEEEDEDIYAVEDMSNYDFGEEKTPAKGPQQQEKSHMAMMGLIEMIDGFSLSSQRNYAPKVYPKPKISQDFIPKHKPRRRRFELKDSEKQGLGRHELTSELRARIIANRLPATVEYRTGVKGQASEPPPKNSTQKSLNTSEVDKIFEEFKNTEGKLRTDFKPFAKNEEKQKRYELYVKMKDKGQKDRYYLAQPKSMTEWERTQEIHEFERAAKLFRPLASTMATRFVSAVTEDTGQGLKEGLNLEVPKQAKQSSTTELDTLGHDVADDRVKAAKMTMFGKLTQTVVDWYPDRVLCRRFNIPHPYPESNFVGVRKSKREKFSIFSFLEGPPRGGGNFQEDPAQEAPLPEPSSLTAQKDENSEEEEKPETYGLKVPVDGPPTMDLFKAIFQDSDSESEEDSSAGKEEDSENVHQETGSSGKSSVDQEASVKKERESSESETDDQRSRNIKSSLDSFLSDMRKGRKENRVSEEEEEEETTNAPESRQKKRVSRFEPKKDVSGDAFENIPKPVFMPRKKTQPAVEAVPAKGIFANIDFDLLNSYRTSGPVEKKDDDEKEEHSPPPLQKVVEECHKVSSDSSVDSEDEYGPPVPAHLKNRQQMIKSPPSSVTQLIANRKLPSEEESHWVVKEEKRKSHKKHRHDDKHKSKKEKKKKKHKERKHKKKSSKKHRRKSDSSSSGSSED